MPESGHDHGILVWSNHETTDARYFAEDELPLLSGLRNTADQVAMCYAHVRGEASEVVFD